MECIRCQRREATVVVRRWLLPKKVLDVWCELAYCDACALGVMVEETMRPVYASTEWYKINERTPDGLFRPQEPIDS